MQSLIQKPERGASIPGWLPYYEANPDCREVSHLTANSADRHRPALLQLLLSAVQILIGTALARMLPPYHHHYPSEPLIDDVRVVRTYFPCFVAALCLVASEAAQVAQPANQKKHHPSPTPPSTTHLQPRTTPTAPSIVIPRDMGAHLSSYGI